MDEHLRELQRKWFESDNDTDGMVFAREFFRKSGVLATYRNALNDAILYPLNIEKRKSLELTCKLIRLLSEEEREGILVCNGGEFAENRFGQKKEDIIVFGGTFTGEFAFWYSKRVVVFGGEFFGLEPLMGVRDLYIFNGNFKCQMAVNFTRVGVILDGTYDTDHTLESAKDIMVLGGTFLRQCLTNSNNCTVLGGIFKGILARESGKKRKNRIALKTDIVELDLLHSGYIVAKSVHVLRVIAGYRELPLHFLVDPRGNHELDRSESVMRISQAQLTTFLQVFKSKQAQNWTFEEINGVFDAEIQRLREELATQ